MVKILISCVKDENSNLSPYSYYGSIHIKKKTYNMNEKKYHLVDLITDIETFIDLKNLNSKNLDIEHLHCQRNIFINQANEIFNNFDTYKDQLDNIGFKYPRNLSDSDACYYLIQHIIKYITNNNNNLIPINVTNRLQLLDSMTTKPRKNCNNLDTGIYLIDNKLEHILSDASLQRMDKPQKKKITKEFFYVVVFNKLWNSKLNRYNLVYNYIKYNRIFFDLYYIYATIEQLSRRDLRHANKGAGYFFLLDNQLKPSDILNEYSFKNSNSIILGNTNTINNVNIEMNFIDICKYAAEGVLLPVPLIEMCYVIDNLVLNYKNNNQNKLDITYKLNRLLQSIKNRTPSDHRINKTHSLIENCQKIIFNNLTRFIFIVSDVRDLVKTIEKLNENKYICQIPKGERGAHSLIGNILYEFDEDFRHSMYNHNKLYRLFDIDYINVNLDWKNFSYKNVHCNLGYAKW